MATLAGLAHLVMGICCLALVVYLLYLTRSPEILGEPDAAGAVHGLKLAAGIITPFALAYLAAGVGVWKARFWGWLLGTMVDVTVSGLLLYDVLDGGRIDWEDTAIGAVFLVPLILLLL